MTEETTMQTIELTAQQTREFLRASGKGGFALVRKMKQRAKKKAAELNEPVALVSTSGSTLFVAHPSGKTSCGGCGTCAKCVKSQGDVEARFID